jgi:predicted nuclease with TOPRIM domain
VDNDNDVVLQQFEEIERKIEKVIERCKSLEAENTRLLTEIERSERELGIKAEAEKNFLEEKALVRLKIDDLLARLENIS